MKSGNKRAGDTVSELAADRGLIGYALRNIPKEIRREADSRLEPWQFLIAWGEAPKQRGAIVRAGSVDRICDKLLRSGFKRVQLGVYRNGNPRARVRDVRLFTHRYKSNHRCLVVTFNEPRLHKNSLRLFEAAESQRRAVRRLAQIAVKAGSIASSWSDKLAGALKRGGVQTAGRAAERVFAGMYRYDRARTLLAEVSQFLDSGPSTMICCPKMCLG